MILNHLGLSATEQQQVIGQVRTGYRAKVKIQLLNLDGEHLDEISDYLTDGQVDGDRTRPVRRQASLTFNDPKRRLPFDTDSAASTAVFLDRMVRVLWCMYIDDWQDWCEIPLITGPVMQPLTRDGDQAVVSVQDKAVFGMAACWKPLHLNKGMRKVDAIRRILIERCGATDRELDFPDTDARLPKPRSLHPQAKPWPVARKIAESMDRQLFYDGAGVCRLRHWPNQTRFSFTGQGHVLAPGLQVNYSDDVVNAVRVLGAQPKGPKTQVVAEAVAPRRHRFSPDRMGRNGVPRYLARFVEDGSIKHHAEAQQRADRELAEGLTQSVDVAFSCVPVHFIDDGDMCHVDTDDGDVTFRFGTFSQPLRIGDGTDGTAMTVGARRRLKRVAAEPKHHPMRRHHG